MGLFDSLTNEVGKEFNIGEKADGLFTVLLSIITDRSQGGFGGFLDRFKEAGLGDLAASWVNVGANMPLSYEQTESVFGDGTLTDVSEQIGLDYKTTTSATAYMVPHIVDMLTPHGEVPDEKGLLSTVSGYIPESISGAAAGAAKAVDAGTAALGDKNGGSSANLDGGVNALLKIILPLIMVVLLVAAGYMLCGKTP